MDKGFLIEIDLAFAKGVLSQVSTIAADLAAQHKLWVAGRLAAELYLASKAVDVANETQILRLQRRLPKLMNDLELVCSWPGTADAQCSILRSLLYKGTPQVIQQVQKGILAFLRDSPFVVKLYLEKLEKFSNSAVRKQPRAHSDTSANIKAPDVDEYPGHVNDTLHTILRKHASCSCKNNYDSGERHEGRLRLRSDIVKIEGCITFDVMFSASPDSLDYWQDLQMMVSMKKNTKRVQLPNETTLETTNTEISERHKVIPVGSFCRIIGAKLGSRICCRVEDSKLLQLYRGSPIIQHAKPGPSMSLRDILSNYRLSNRMKLVLAYIIAQSFWRYYDSPWMNTRWSSDTIHFLPEPNIRDFDNLDITEQTVFYVSKPYFIIKFSGRDEKFAEYCDGYSVIYRYPRMVALAIILLEVGRGQSLQIADTGIMEADLNRAWELATRLLKNPKSWGGFDYTEYHKVVHNLLDGKLFCDGATASCDTVDTEIATRKAIIYNVVVAPLRNLINTLGYSGTGDGLDPIIPTDSSPILNVPTPDPLRPLPQDGQRNKAAKWLDDLSPIIENIRELSRQIPPDKRARPIRVAILDTGYDDEAIFFQNTSRRQRLKGWLDLVSNSRSPVDESGHGTHTVSLVMKTAPLVHIYVARIAKDHNSLSGSVQHILNAINWAVNDCEADIISMSFGFHDEIHSISDTISKAELSRDKRVLFFAAASNSGANHREMFPANHDSVISVRETNSHGAFSDTNPPVDPNGPIAYGTLGRDVPSAWLRNVDGELSKSGSSVATAVAVGIAAMILQYASIGFTDCTSRLPAQVKKLWTRRGMLAMFYKISQDMGNRCFFISPHRFFSQRDEEGVWAAMREACT